MVYSIGSRDPYPTTTGVRIIDGDYDCVTKMSFLRPDEVDAVSTIQGRIQMTQGYPVDPETAPKKICWQSSNRAVPDFITCATVLVISERLREIIEKFEPGVHQFLPIDVYRPKTQLPFAYYYWLVVCNRIDSVDENLTTYTWLGNKSIERGMWDGEGDQSRILIFNNAQIGNCHIWRDRYLSRFIFITDEMANAFNAAGLSGLERKHYDSV